MPLDVSLKKCKKPLVDVSVFSLMGDALSDEAGQLLGHRRGVQQPAQNNVQKSRVYKD